MKIKVCLALTTIVFLNACKKGEDDPAFTLLSRTERISGDWVLQSGFVEAKFQNSKNDADYLLTMEGKEFSLDVADSVPGVEKGPYDLRLHFEKDGKLSVDEDIYAQGFTFEGTWDFLRGSGEAKNKERIMLMPEVVKDGSTFSYHPLLTPDIQPVYFIRELRKDKLVLVYSGQPYISTAGSKLNLAAEFVFVR